MSKEKYDDDERAALLRRARDVVDPLAGARDLVKGRYDPLATPETAREVFARAERMQRAQNELDWLEAEERADAPAARRAARRVELHAIRAKLQSSADGHVFRAASLLADHAPHERIPDEKYAQFRRAVTAVVTDADLEHRLGELEERTAAEARVTSEPPIYGPGSPHSWFVDRAIAADVTPDVLGGSGFHDLSPDAVNERLAKHAVEVRRAWLKRGKDAQRIENLLREQRRTDDPEQHRRLYRQTLRELRGGLTTGGGATASSAGGGGAALVPPSFILEAWAPFRGVERSFANQCDPWPLPEYGLQLYVPAFASATGVSQQTEATGVSESDPTETLQGAQLQTVTGQVTISQQLHDRGFTGGGAFDQVMAKQLGQQLNEKLDLYVLNTVIANGAAVTGASSFSIANLYADIAKGREQLTDTAGVRLRPTCFFSTSDLYSYATRQLDGTNNRPIVTPQYAPGYPISAGADDGLQSDQRKPKWSRFTGTILPGNLLWFTDDNIPASSSNTQLLVSAPDEAVVLAESDTPILTVYPETYAGSLDVVVNLRSYVAAVTRHSAGTAVIVGSAYTTSLV